MLPLSSLRFEDGKIEVAEQLTNQMSAPLTSAAMEVLERLAKEKVLTPGPATVPLPSMLLEAKFPGSWVSVEIEISNVVPDEADANETSFDVRVTEVDLYSGLDPGGAEDTLGAHGSKRGLFEFIPGTGEMPEATDIDLGDPPSAEVPDADGNVAFTIQSASTTEGQSISVKPDDGQATFSITAVWTKSTNVRLKNFAAEFGDVLKVTEPAGGFRVPSPGTIRLIGATDGVGPTPSKGTVFTH